MCHEKLDPGASPIPFLSQSSEDARNRLRRRQQLFLGQKIVEELRLIRHGPETPAHVKLKTTPLRTIYDFCSRYGTQVVHISKTARVLPAPGKRDLELPTKILRVRMAQQKL